jgi:predicted acylesterase/phospholipase RssA
VEKPSGIGSPEARRLFALVLVGGGARGFAHVGVLRALANSGYRPDRIVGVSVGALVGVAYARRVDWYRAVVEINLDGFPGPVSNLSARTSLKDPVTGGETDPDGMDGGRRYGPRRRC